MRETNQRQERPSAYVAKKYPEGYYPKLRYWSNTLQEAIGRRDLDMIQKCSEKIAYFTQRQLESQK